MLVSRVVHTFVERVLRMDEAGQTRRGREAIAHELYEFAMRLKNHHQIDVPDIFEVVRALNQESG